MAQRTCNIADQGNSGAVRSLRDIPPAHYTVKIESFSELSKLLEDTKVQNYESDIFETGGFRWKLSLYPDGDKERNGKKHISLYLVIADTNDLPLGWEVNVNFKLFVYDQIKDKYMTIQDDYGKVRRFHEMRMEWGFSQLLPLTTFKDASNGYLVHDKCAFGAEVFVINYSGKGETVSVFKGPHAIDTYTSKIDKFSSQNPNFQSSDVFSIGDRKWKLWLYPKGDVREEGKYVSLFIELDDTSSFPSYHRTHAKYLLRIRDQRHGKHVELTGTYCFTVSAKSRGWPSFLSLSRLRDAAKGFLVNDTLIIEAQILTLSTVKKLQQ